ncbi:MAG: hypothetical protein ABIO40_06085 [Devosia sp.]
MKDASLRVVEIVLPLAPLGLLCIGARYWWVAALTLSIALVYVGLFFLFRPKNDASLRAQLTYLLAYPLVTTVAYQAWALVSQFTQSLDGGLWLFRDGWFTPEGAARVYLSLVVVAGVPLSVLLVFRRVRSKWLGV